MALFNPGSGTGSNPRARAQRLELLLGILAFFTVMAAIQTVVLELRGGTPVLPALLLLVLVLAVTLVWRARRRLDV